MEHCSHHVAPTSNLIRRGYHDVLADRKVAQRPAYLDSGPAFVRHITHHNKQVYVAPLVGVLASPRDREPKSTTRDGWNRPTTRSTMTEMSASEVIVCSYTDYNLVLGVPSSFPTAVSTA